MSPKERTTGEGELRPTSFSSLEKLLDFVSWIESVYQPLVESDQDVDILLKLCLSAEFHWSEIEEEAYSSLYKELDAILRNCNSQTWNRQQTVKQGVRIPSGFSIAACLFQLILYSLPNRPYISKSNLFLFLIFLSCYVIMVMKYQPSPNNLQELCEFIQYATFIEAQYGKLNSASRSLSHLCKLARTDNGVWSLKEELSFNRVSSELHRVMSRAFVKKTLKS